MPSARRHGALVRHGVEKLIAGLARMVQDVGLVEDLAQDALVALMEIQASRAAPRIGSSGEPILLLDRDRALWDHPLIRRGLAALAKVAPSPVVELDRAVAVATAFGPAASLESADALTSEPSFEAYHLLPSVRGDLLAGLGRFDEARAEFERGASLTHNARERKLLLERAAGCAGGSAPPQPT